MNEGLKSLLTEQSYEHVERSLPSKGEKSISVIKSTKNEKQQYINTDNYFKDSAS